VSASTTIVVNSFEDKVNNDGMCTLREAILAANKDSASGRRSGECLAGSAADVVTVPAGVYILTRTDSGKEDSGATGDLDITADLTLIGSGKVTISAPPGFSDRIFHILKGKVSLYGLTVSGGNVAGDGGGIFNAGSLTLEKATLTGNRASGRGGGLFNQGSLTLTNVTITGNRAGSSALSSSGGGGLYHAGGTAALNYLTIHGNTSNGPAGSGDNVRRSSGTLTLKGVILGGASSSGNCAGAIVSAGNNLSGDMSCTGSLSQPSDLNGVDPRLGALQDNGGQTHTHALLAGSAAIDAGGDAGCPQMDQRGAARPRGAACDIGSYETSGNDSWTSALRLNPGSPVQGYLDKSGQSKWFKFAVEPGARVIVRLTELPANYDLTLYKDIAAAFQELTSVDDLVRMDAEFAPDAFSPDAFSPDAFSPDAFSPDAYSPDAFSPDAFSPDAYSPDAYSPDAFSPDAYSPDAYSPDAYSPDAYSPDAFSPDAYSPDAYSPDAFSPDAFSSAQVRSLIGVSAFEGTAGEGITVNTWDNTGDFYVRVRGRGGVYSVSSPFRLEVNLLPGTCSAVSADLPSTSLEGTSGPFRTLILSDMARMEGSAEDKAALRSSLDALANRSEVQGIVLDVGSDARVAEANAQADAYPACPFAKNLVAESVEAVIDSYWALNPLEYLVIVGNDAVIPFFRHPDRALLASEKNYAPPVRDDSASQASLKLGYILSQDRYGADLHLSTKTTEFPLPELAIGRLVETPGEVSRLIEAYLSTPDSLVPTPASALVTGYDFLEDVARAVQEEFQAGIGTSAETLIAERELSPEDPASWSADQLRSALLGGGDDLIFLAGHFSASAALAADYRTRLYSSEVVDSDVDLQNAIILGAGCHAGYNIVDPHDVPGVTREPDWAQAFARKGATLFAGTGYQYGDTDFIEYSERLYLELARQLRMGTGPVAVGKALTAAKQAYLAVTPQPRGLHEKALLQATLFGLPMLSVDLPGERLVPSDSSSVVTGANPFTTNPGAALGLRYADVTVAPSLTTHTVLLTNPSDRSTAVATYLVGEDGVITNPGEPALPLEVRNVGIADLALRGLGFRSGSYTETDGVLPLIGAPTTELRGVHTPFRSDVLFPVQPWTVNYLGALMGGTTLLSVTPAQWVSSAPGSSLSTLRSFDGMTLRLYYSDNVETYGGNSTPALSAPPSINSISAHAADGRVKFQTHVVGNPAAGIQEVWVTYTALHGPFAGAWQSLNLVQGTVDSTLWEGSLDLGATSPEDLRFMVQAVNGVGLVGLATNLGAYYVPASGTQTPVATSLALELPASSAPYGTQSTFAASLTQDGSPLPGMTVAFGLGAQSRRAVTDASGRASVTIPLLGLPGLYDVRASFAGTAEYSASSDTRPFSILTQSTAIELIPQEITAIPGTEVPLIAVLTDAMGRRLGEKTVYFEVTGENGIYRAAAITDYAGRAAIGVVPLPAGGYSVTATYLPGDDRFTSATAMGTLILNTPPDCSSAISSLGPLWPPNNEFYPVNVLGVTDADGDPITIVIDAIFQDEPVGTDGNSPDGRGVGTDTAEVRSERDGNGNGRVYHVFFTATDGRGGSCTGVVRVPVVPHDQGDDLTPYDEGPLYDSTLAN
jgi:CSLREA domain-containing protein